jgi:hypothetical protein
MRGAETGGAAGLSDGRPIRAQAAYASWSHRPRSGRFQLPDVHNIACGPLAIRRPRLHQLAPLLQRVATPIGLLRLVADDVGQSRFGNFAREVGDVACPIPEAGSEPVVSGFVDQIGFKTASASSAAITFTSLTRNSVGSPFTRSALW